jgi:predicted flap endonuclease-1-like 5' DNA nuclease
MRDSDDDTTIGTGGWLLVALAGTITFVVLQVFVNHDFFPALVFALAIALIVYLLLYRLAVAVNRYDDEEEALKVRKIVPASAPTDHGARVSGVEGTAAAVARSVRVGAEPASASPVLQRPSTTVTPLAKVEPAPLIAPPVAVPAAPAVVTLPVAPKVEAPRAATSAVEAKPKVDARPAVDAKPLAEAKPKAEVKSKVDAKPKVETKPWTEKPAPKPEAEKPAAKPTAKPAAKPKAEKPAAKPKAEPVGLVRLAAPRDGKADDLKEIEGIGPALEKLVNGMGFYHFDQIAAWTEADVAMVDGEMKNFKGRIARDKWVAQARLIVAEGLEAFRIRAKTNNY